jgi:DNA repair exonuclease SbcCD nuclease subunit
VSSFSFIHAADLHLDSPFKSIAHLDPGLADRLISESQAAFSRLIEHCIGEKVDFLLISGDAFDSGSGNLSGQLHFLSGMNKLESAGIPVYMICGNHDPLDQWSSHLDLPANVHQFSGDQVERITHTIEGQDIGIYGISYPTREEQRNLAQLFKSDASDAFSIGLLHGNFGSNTGHANYAPFILPDLQSAGMDYWALGHIHKRQIVSDSRPLAIYPGNIQGRHFNETGEKGCMKIQIESGAVQATDFVPLSKVVFERVELDISEVENLNDFHRRLSHLSEEKNYHEDISVVVRLTLKGATPLHAVLNEEEVRSYFHEQIQDFTSHFIFIDRIINNTRPEFDLEERIQSADFVGDVLRRFESLKHDETALSNLAHQLFEDIRSSKFNHYIPDITKEECLETLEKGQWNLIERLIQDKK